MVADYITLSGSDTPTGQTNAVLSEGTISSSDLEGPMEDRDISDLVLAMSNGVTYVNVHTEANPDGEIRGQIKNALLPKCTYLTNFKAGSNKFTHFHQR